MLGAQQLYRDDTTNKDVSGPTTSVLSYFRQLCPVAGRYSFHIASFDPI
jgi:hypothetical protein